MLVKYVPEIPATDNTTAAVITNEVRTRIVAAVLIEGAAEKGVFVKFLSSVLFTLIMPIMIEYGLYMALQHTVTHIRCFM